MVRIDDCSKTNMFWGVTIDAGKRYSQIVEQGFRLSMAALENKTESKEYVQVMLQHESSEYLLCTLRHGNLLQQPLDLAFATGEQVSFSLNGSGVVHLTGYLITDMDESDIDEEFSDSDEDAPELMSVQEMTGKRKAEPALKKSKKIKLLNDKEEEDEESEDEEDDSEDEEEEDFSDDFDDSYFDNEDSEDDEEEIEDDDDEDDEDEEEVEVMAKKGKKAIETPQPKNNKQAEQKTPQANKNKTPKENKSTSAKKSQSYDASETPKQMATKESAETPSTPNGEDVSSKKKKKKKKKKNKNNDTENSSMNESKSETPSTTPSQTATKKKVVGGGTLVEDLKMGNGPEAKPGKMVSVYYVGTLAKNNKRFDSCTGGKPFRFRLNQGEVIKGWDNGVAGMKVGGKRRLTVPASQGYGNTRQGPIPPNSTLTFEVELKAVS